MRDQPDFDSDALGGLYERPGFMLRRCIQATGSLFEQSCRDLGITQGQYDVLHILTHLGAVDQDELARALGLDRATTGAIARGLEQKKLIRRKVKPTDKRKRVITLTQAGEDMFKAAEPAAIEARDALFATLSAADQKTVIDLLRKIAASANPHIKATLKTDWA